MGAYEIRPFDEASVAEIAAFLIQSLGSAASAQQPSNGDDRAVLDRSAVAREYRWLLDDANPARSEGIPAGEMIRDHQGKVMGMIGYCPVYFQLGDRRLVGLGAHNFFVDPSTRMQGFILFRRYLNNPAADFCFSTTCSPASGPLWSKCGGASVPGSDSEFLLVLHTGPVLREMAIRRGIPQSISTAMGVAGAAVGLVLRPYYRRSRLKPERCDDWETLAEIAERNRDRARLTPERSVAALRRRYAAMARSAISTGAADGVYRFTTSAGRDGWFSVNETKRASSGTLWSLNILDIVEPRDSVDVSDVLLAAIEVAGSRSDVLSVRDRSAWGLRPRQIGLRRRVLPAPEAFVFSCERSGLPQPSELVRIADFPQAFGV